MSRTLVVIAVFAALICTAAAQTPGIIRGQVTDESGAVIPGAKVAVSNSAGVVKTVTTSADGSYVVNGLADGAYTVVGSSPGLKQAQPAAVEVSAGTPKTVNLTLMVTLEKQVVTVQGEAGGPTVSVDASSNASQLVLKKEDLDALSDDPDDLQQDLQARKSILTDSPVAACRRRSRFARFVLTRIHFQRSTTSWGMDALKS